MLILCWFLSILCGIFDKHEASEIGFTPVFQGD
jgi:hypothetical protein